MYVVKQVQDFTNSRFDDFTIFLNYVYVVVVYLFSDILLFLTFPKFSGSHWFTLVHIRCLLMNSWALFVEPLILEDSLKRNISS